MTAIAQQTGATCEYISDLRDIAPAAPELRTVTSPEMAASMLTEELLSRLRAVVQAHPGDPVVLLSGGVDSIAVAAAAVQAGIRPHAITVVTEGGTDADNAIAAAKALGLTHELIDLTATEIADLAREATQRLGVLDLWEVSYAIPLLAAARALDGRADVGALLTGAAADAILAGGKTVQSLGTPEATEEVDRIIRKESSANFHYERLVPDFYERVIPAYADRFVLVFQTVRFWEIAETFGIAALFGDRNGATVDKLCLRIACEHLLPEGSKTLAWAKKSAIQKSAGIMGALGTAARRYAADLPGARTYTDPMNEPYEAVAARLFLALISNTVNDHHERS